MLMRKVMAEQPVAAAVQRVEAAVVLKEADAARKVVVAEVLLMILAIPVERADVEVVANLVAEESLALRRIQAIGASSSRTTTT